MATYTGTDKRIQFLFDMVSNFAPIYSNTGTYAVGAYAIYQGVLYKCITAVTVAEDFDPTKWTQVLVMNEIGSGGGGGSTVTITPTLSSGTKIADYSINGVGDSLYAPSGGGGVPEATLLWQGDFIGAGTINVPHLSEYALVAYAYDSDIYVYWSVGTPRRGGSLYGVYMNQTVGQFAHRFSQNGDILTVSNEDRGLYMSGSTTYQNGASCHVRAVFGLIKKPTS